MFKAFLKFLGAEEGEDRQMWLLLGKGACMGVFLATYQVGSQSLFIQELGKHYLDKAFFATGALGIISTALFVFLQRKVNFSTLVITNTFLIFLFVAALRWAFEYLDYSAYTDFKILPFILFAMMGPVTSITLLGFWGVFGRMFDTRQTKRIIGGIDTGQLVATIIAFFSIPLITRLPFVNNTYDLLFVSAVAALGIFVFTIIISLSWNIDKSSKVNKGEKIEKITYGSVFKNKYTRLLSFFMVFSMGAAIFVDFTFYTATEIMFPEEQKLNDFLSFFNGIIILFSFFIQSFINDIIIGRFGLKVALMTMPVILILFMIGGIISGHLYGYEVLNKQFLLFFMFAVSGKLFTASLRDALESPAFKLFFLPFDLKIRFDIQTRIEGVVSELATLMAGLLQMGLALLVFFKLIHYAYFVIALALMVIYLSYKLYDQYKITLTATLKKQKEKLADLGKRNEHNAVNILKQELKSRKPLIVFNALKIYEKLDPIAFQFNLLDQINSKIPAVRQYAYRKLNEHQCFTALDIIKRDIKTEGDETALELAEQTIKDLEESVHFEITDVSIRKYVRSTEPKERIRGARLLVNLTEDKHVAYVIELLRDINPEVRLAAIETAGKIKRPEVWNILIENLNSAVYGNAAMSALKHTGEVAFHNVDTAFYKTGQYHSTMLRIVQILGSIGGRQGTELLWKKIDFPNKAVITELLLSLSYIGFEGRDFQAARIKIIIESLIGDYAWNIRTMQDIPHSYPVNPLDRSMRNAMIEENKVNHSNIFMLLGMIYDPQNVLLVKENLDIGSTDSITFAIEMLDVFVEDELKPKLFPVLDELKDEERLKRLFQFYPPEKFESYADLLKQIVNRDYNRITRYSKAIALYRLAQLEGVSVSNVLIANLFNPDELLAQVTADGIYKLDKEMYHSNTKRLKPSIKKKLDKAILPPVFVEEGEDYHHVMLHVERVLFIKDIFYFSEIPGEIITRIVDVVEEIMVAPGTVLIDEGDKGNEPIYFVVDGEVDIVKDGESMEIVNKKGLIGDKLLLSTEVFDFKAVTTTSATLLVLNKDDLMDLCSKHLPILNAYIDILKDVKAEEDRVGELDYDMSLFS